jgi:hypothetical protein
VTLRLLYPPPLLSSRSTRSSDASMYPTSSLPALLDTPPLALVPAASAPPLPLCRRRTSLVPLVLPEAVSAAGPHEWRGLCAVKRRGAKLKP